MDDEKRKWYATKKEEVETKPANPLVEPVSAICLFYVKYALHGSM
jgi:hypothetical protein